MDILSPYQSTLKHINSITHEGKVIVLATDTDGKIWYTIKQDGFEDSYLNTPADQRTGWENWQQLELPNETKADDSVVNQEQAELTYLTDSNRYILRSRYQTVNEIAVAPVQLISAFGHLYVFRQSKTNTLLVDRFVVDGMTNKLNRKLEVRFKRSRQKYEATKKMKKSSQGLTNTDSLDFRDANGNFFYEPTTEICIVNNLQNGWFSVVLVPTIENDVYRWHIFAYNSQTQKVELTTLRASEDGLFAVKDYTIFEEIQETFVPRQIVGVIKRTLDITGAIVTNGLTATKYDLQQEQQTQSGDMQLLKTATRLMLAIPTDKGTAAFSFAIAGDGTLSEIDETPDKTLIRSKQREILLPLNTLDEIKALADRTPPPQGIITGLAEGTDEEDAENLVKITTDGKAGELANGDLVKILGTFDYQGLYQAKTVDENTFDIDLTSAQELGYWEKEDEEEGGLIFDGMITAYEKTADGKLRVTCPNHGLENGDQVQIAGTEDYNDSYPVKKLDDTHFIIERQWATGSAINIKLISRKRRGIVFDGTDDHVALPEMNHNYSQGLTVEAWVWYDGFKSWSRIIDFGNGAGVENIVLANEGTSNDLSFQIYHGTKVQSITAQGVLETGKWMHLAASIDELGRATLYKNGEAIKTGSVHLPKTINRTQNYIARSNWSSNWSSDCYFQGKISDLRLWKTERTAEDIKNSMYLQLTGQELGLVGYWRLGAIGEGQIVDFSSNGQDGTVYGDAYVSAATLNRKLAGGLDAVKYSNSDLFAVSKRATYEESFEFKVVSSSAVNLAYLDNADGKNLGTKIFTLSYWGKTSRSAEEKQVIAPEQIKQNKFEDLGGGWYRVSGNVTIPDGISMLRCFEIANVKGDWQSLEIRKHRIRLMSDSITEFKYSDSISLTTLADNQATLASKLNQLQLKEQQEGVLLKEKQELDAKIAAYNAKDATRAKIKELESKIATLTTEEQGLSTEYLNQRNSPFNYYCYIINSAYENYRLAPCGMTGSRYNMVLRPNGDDDYYHKWKFVSLGQNSYHIINSAYENYRLAPCGMTGGRYNMVLRPNGDDDYYHKWQFVSLGDQSNNNITLAYNAWQTKLQELNQAKKDLGILKAGLGATAADKLAWDNRLAQVIKEITALQTELNTLNTDFLKEVKTTQQTPQTMPQIAKDGKGLVTKGANLGFVNSVTRLNAMETSEGNVQLSYFDNQGRMQQKNYDATADSKNATFEQWIPDAQRTCLNFNNSNSVVKLNQPLYLPSDWSIEAWFVYPLPETAEWNTLIRGKDADHHIVVRNRKQLGIFLSNDLLEQKFYDSGFNMELLSEGWHHLTAVGKGDTTLFYIDGKAVGNTKAKALADAEENLKKAPNDATAKKKVEDIKKAILKTTSDVFAIGNNHSALDKPVDYSVMKFDGVNDSINIGNVSSLNLKDNFTIEAWVYPTNVPRTMVIYSLSDNIFAIEQELLLFQKGGGSFETIGRSATNNRLTVNKWNHVVVVKSGSMTGQTKLYINGIAIDAQTAIPTLTNVGQIQLGSQPNVGRYFQGQMAEVRVWNKARTQAEIQATMGKRLSGKEINLVAYYPLDKIESGKVLDLVTNNYATVVEASIVNDQPLSIIPFIPSEQFGKLSEVRVWGVALTDEEIAVNSKTLLSGNEPGLFAYYPFNEATGEIIRDQSGQGYNGAVSGAIWWGCTAPIGNPGNTVMQFDGVNDAITVGDHPNLRITSYTLELWIKPNGTPNEAWKGIIGKPGRNFNIWLNSNGFIHHRFHTPESTRAGVPDTAAGSIKWNQWNHVVITNDGTTAKTYINGQLSTEGATGGSLIVNQTPLYIGCNLDSGIGSYFKGQMAEVRIWNKARTQAEIQGDMYQRLTGKEANLVAYYPLDKIQTEGSVQKVLDLAGNNHGTVTEAIVVEENSLPIVPNTLLCNEYSSVSLDSNTNRKVAMMRRFFAHPSTNGVTLLPDKRVEALELKWVGNAQFAPTLLGYIEGPPPVPSENFTVEYNNVDDYNGATSVQLTMSEDVAFSWNRSQDGGLGASFELFGGADKDITKGVFIQDKMVGTRQGFKGNFDFSYQFQNASNITSRSSLSMTDKLELHGGYEIEPKFPHLGKRFIPKNIGYALVVSAIADVFVTRLARSGKMIGYQVQPVDGIPPDVNTITFLMNPAYTMNGSLDGMTGSSATSERFFKHVPEMRSQYGSLYPASYYRLKEAYNLKEQIEAEDKRRESYFSNFDVRLVDETSLNRNIDSGDAPSTVGVQREEDKPTTQMTEEEKKKAEEAKLQKEKDEAAAKTKEQQTASQQKQAEIQSKIGDQEKRVQATDSFAGWQKRMESIQIRSGKRNIVNTYVWDADGGLRTEAQSFANTVEHTIGGSFTMNAGLGFESQLGVGSLHAELTAQATVNLTQTMSKTETRSKGFELNVDLSGLEYKGITDYKDRPILPAEKVDRYRFMSFYLEGSTNHFQDFFNYVVDPEWLASNDEEARALRQTQAGKPNKAWRVLHRVTYVERPALMGFGRDVRQLRAADELSDQQNLLAKIAKLEESNRQLEAKLDKILNLLPKT